MPVKKIKKLAEYGMGIAAHTKTHPDLTQNLTDEQLWDEIFGSKERLEELGFKIRTFVYPGGAYNDRVISYVKEAGYVCARSCNDTVYHLDTTDPNARFYIGAYPIANETSQEDFKRMLANAGRQQLVCLCYHFVSDTGPPETSVSVEKFQYQMQYLKENGFTVALLPDLFR